jgi:tetratricopeptide (TPR) repeat protein
MQQSKKLHYIFAALSFLVPLIVYTITMQPTIPFWDCGEFASAAYALQVPHPPGAPLHTLFGRVFMMLPIFEDPVARFNWLSVLSSALTCLFLYLTVVRLIRIWRGDAHTTADGLVMFGGGLIAALTYTFTDSFWFNALESEVYAFGSLFIAIIPWLIMVWYDHADDAHNEKYLVLIFYVIGLSMGVHQLAMLTLFPLFMLVYYRKWHEVTTKGWLIMGALAVVAFFIAYKLVLSYLVQWIGNGFAIVSIVALVGALYGIYYSQKAKKPVLNLALWSAMMLFLGYTTYAVLMVRAEKDPPMNQWNVSSFKNMAKYINREQYGEAKLIPRRNENYKGDPQYAPTWGGTPSTGGEPYTSAFDFFIRYQTNHMYNRYLLWQFVGRQSDVQDTGVDPTKTLAIPMILGLFGLYWHFRRDPKRALSFLAMFLLLGLITTWYQNQQDPQPRERDYFYVGSFYVYAMWVGIGAVGLMELLRHKFGGVKDLPPVTTGQAIHGHASDMDTIPVVKGDSHTGALALTLGLVILLVPINMCVGLGGMLMGKSFEESSKWAMYTKQGNYIPYDYAYNILQSCEPDAVIFTAGDNDTFPLWCIQDVYGVRRDVRIVNLSLGKMGWYIRQLKRESWGAKPLNLPSFSEERLAMIDDGRSPAYTSGPSVPTTVNVSAEAMRKFTGDPNAGAGEMKWNWRGEYRQGENNAFLISDQLVREIIMQHINDRPIYFASVVPSSYMGGLDNHIIYEGLAGRVTPIAREQSAGGIEVAIDEAKYRATAFNEIKEPALTPTRGMIIRSYNDPNAGRSFLDERYGWSTYSLLFTRLANYYMNQGKNEDAMHALDRLTALLPPDEIEYDAGFLSLIAQTYSRAGNAEKALKFMQLASTKLRPESASVQQDPEEGQRVFMLQVGLGDAFRNMKQYDSARVTFENLRSKLPEGQDRNFVDYKIKLTEAQRLDAAGNTAEAKKIYDELVTRYQSVVQTGLAAEFGDVMRRQSELSGGARPSDTAQR